MHRPSRSMRPALVAIAAIAVPIVLAGCAPASDGEVVGDSSQPSPSPSAEPTSSEAQAIDTSDWLEYSTHDGDMTYRYPASWTLASESVESPADAGSRWFDSATLTAPNGQQLLQSSDFVDVGGACGSELYPIELLAEEPTAAEPLLAEQESHIVTIAVGTDDGRWTLGVGIASVDRLPQPGDTGCGWLFVHGSSDGGVSIGTQEAIASIQDDPLWTIDSLDDATAYMETDEYATILEILRSVRTS